MLRKENRPIVRKSLPNSLILRRKLVVYGHKYFSKFVVSGESTKETLINIKKSNTIKHIQRFEFDP